MKKIKGTVRQSDTNWKVWFVTISDEDAIAKCGENEWCGVTANHALHIANLTLQEFGYEV